MNNLKKRRLEQIRAVVKWLLTFLTASAAYILLTAVPVSFPLPLLFLPMTVAVASKEEPFNAGLWGCICGLMTDSAFGKLFGFNAIIFTFAAVLISLLFQYILRQNILNIAMLNFVLIPLQASLDFLFFYGIWGRGDAGNIWVHIYMPQMLLTFLLSVPVYLLTAAIFKRFGPIEENYIEEKSDDIVRE